MSQFKQNNKILVYSDEGAGIRSIQSTINALQKELSPQIKIVECSAEQIIFGDVLDKESVKMLVMPGGADLPYCDKLNGQGNKKIKEYVMRGGSYLGLCAGAYYACDRIEFEIGSSLEVQGERELTFFKGVAIGSVVPGFHYANETGAAACQIKFQTSNSEEICFDYVNGGPGFHPYSTQQEEFQPIARYVDVQGTPLAALRCSIGSGVAVLCGSHPELDVSFLFDYLETLDTESEEYVKVDKMCKILAKNSEQRQKFWQTLIINAGLSYWMNVEQKHQNGTLDEISQSDKATLVC